MSFNWNPILQARAGEPVLRNLAVSGGRSISGREQRVIGDAGFWVVPVRGIVVNTRARAAAYRAMVARLRQGEQIVLPICDLYKPQGFASRLAEIKAPQGAALRATVLDLAVTEIDLQPGHYLSTGERLYLVTEIVSGPSRPPFLNPIATGTAYLDAEPWTDRVAGASIYSVGIVPPLRAAIPAGTVLSARDLKLRCEMQDLADGDLDLDLGRFGTPNLTFVESV